MSDGLGSANSLWLDHEPTLEEILEALDRELNRRDGSIDRRSTEPSPWIIFCGYGEPTCAFDNLIATSKYLKQTHPSFKIRVNTNGLSDLINKKPTAKILCENVDSISISLNAPKAKQYLDVTKPIFGLESFDAMLKFTKECRTYLTDVTLSVVDTLSPKDIESSRTIAEDIGVHFRIRTYGE